MKSVIHQEAARHRADSLALALDTCFGTSTDVNGLQGKLRDLQRHLWQCDLECYGLEVTKAIRREQRRLLLAEIRIADKQAYVDACLPEVEAWEQSRESDQSGENPEAERADECMK